MERTAPGRGPAAAIALGGPPIAFASLAAGAILAITLYVAAFGAGTIRSLGADSAGYVVQMRGATSGTFEFQGARPGTAAAGAFLAGIGITPAGSAPIVMSVALAAILGLVAAVALRSMAGVPGWASGLVVLIVATWGGTARLASGYLANLLSLTPFLLAVFVALTRSGPLPSVAVFVVGVACFLAHPALSPVYLAITVGWVLVGFVRRRSLGPGLRDDEAFGTTLSLLGAAAFVAAVVFGPLHLAVRDLADFTFSQGRFQERASDFLHWVSPGIAVAMVVAGVLACRLPVGIRARAAASRLVISWLLVSGAGLAMLHLTPSQPGYRTLLLGIPVPMLGALLVVGLAHILIDRIRPDGWARAIASGTVLLLSFVGALAIAATTLRPFEAKAIGSADPSANSSVSELIAGYLHSVDPARPVILVVNPNPGARLRWKGRLNEVRSLAPDAVFLRTFLYLGDERRLLQGLPTVRHGAGAGLFNLASRRTWAEVRPTLAEDPIIVVPRRWVKDRVWDRVAGHRLPSTHGVAVVRGPVPPTLTPIGEPQLPAVEAMLRILGVILMFGLLGSGWSAAVLGARPTASDRIALAPAFGICVVVVTSVTVAIAGMDPAGPVSLAAVALAGAAGWIRVLVVRHRVRASVEALRRWPPRSTAVPLPALRWSALDVGAVAPAGTRSTAPS